MKSDHLKAMKAIADIKERQRAKETHAAIDAKAPGTPQPEHPVQEVDQKARPKGNQLVRVILPALVVLALAYRGYVGWLSYGGVEGASGSVAGALGQGVVFLIISAVLGMIPHKENPRRKWLIFAPVFVTWCVYTAHPYQTAALGRRQGVIALSSLQQEMERIVRESEDSGGIPTRIGRSDTIPQASGLMGEIERFLNEYWNRRNALANEYRMELDAIGWSSILDAQRIGKDTTLSESRLMIERAKALVDKYAKKSADITLDAPARISAFALSEAEEKVILDSFNRGLRISGPLIAEQWNVEKQIILQFENMFLLLAASKAWVVEDEHILFSRDAELAQFNSYFQRVEQLSQQAAQIMKKHNADVIRRVEALKDELAR